VLLDFFGSTRGADAFVGVALKQILEKVDCVGAEAGMLLEFVALYFLEHFFAVLVEIGRQTIEHLVE